MTPTNILILILTILTVVATAIRFLAVLFPCDFFGHSYIEKDGIEKCCECGKIRKIKG